MLPITDTLLSPAVPVDAPPFIPSATAARQNAILRRRQDPLAASYASALRACAESSDPLARALQFRTRLIERDYLRVLCKQFRYAETLWHLVGELRIDLAYLNHDRRVALMTDRELDLWAQLPSQVEVYRGCYWDNTEGVAWTLAPDLAVSFVADNRRRDASPLLARGTVATHDCVVKTAWNRVYIVSSQVEVGAVEQLEA